VFTKVLVLNRGEIAVRIIRTCQEIGIVSAVAYSDPDENSLAVRSADEAYHLPGSTARDTYLNVDEVLALVRRSKADAVHPGYGLLSENAHFARRLQSETSAIWVGPPPDVIATMGDKVAARRAADAAGVPTVPGSMKAVLEPNAVVEFGERHGWPVALKAAFGGGGRGIRVVTNPESAEAGLASAQRESLASFGRDEVYLERFLRRPRHVEIQVLADGYGHAVSLGERDCTVQRRHQKLIEEAPAAGLDEKVREAMTRAALDLVSESGYVNAGTVEFLYEDDAFYFLEMNTRLQVEHPVTETMTGIDLVAHQLSIAARHKLELDQRDIQRKGHAIEFRVNAEREISGRFLPVPGLITQLSIPSDGHVRWDGGYESGDEIGQYYDNLVGKLIVHGADRRDAIERAAQALAEIDVRGVPTSIPVHRRVLDDEAFRLDRHHVRWLEEELLPS